MLNTDYAAQLYGQYRLCCSCLCSIPTMLLMSVLNTDYAANDVLRKKIFCSPYLNKFWIRRRIRIWLRLWIRISLKSGIRIRIKTFWIRHTDFTPSYSPCSKHVWLAPLDSRPQPASSNRMVQTLPWTLKITLI